MIKLKMKALLLAAGRGSRLTPYTDERPKCMVEVGKKPLIEWQYAALRNCALDEIGIVHGYLGDKIHIPQTFLIKNDRWSETNMVSSLYCARDWIKGGNVIISYTDILYSSDIVRCLMGSEHDIAITVDPSWYKLWNLRFSNPFDDAETLKMSDDGILQEIGQQPTSSDQVEAQYMGLIRLSERGWSLMNDAISNIPPDERDKMDMTSLLSHMITQGIKINCVSISSSWMEIDSSSDLELAEKMFQDGRLQL